MKNFVRNVFIAAGALGMVTMFSGPSADAATLASSTMTVSATVSSTCSMTLPASMSIPDYDGVTTHALVGPAVTATMLANCPDQGALPPPNVVMDSTLTPGAEQMVHTSGDVLNYQLINSNFAGTSATPPAGTNFIAGVPFTDDGTDQALDISLWVAPGQTGISVGTYNDTVGVTIEI